MHYALSLKDIINFGSLQPVRPRGLLWPYYCVSQTITEIQVSLVRMQELPKNGIVPCENLLAMTKVFYEHDSCVPPSMVMVQIYLFWLVPSMKEINTAV
jgi:hypothetical protein